MTPSVSRIGLIIARLYATLSSLVCRCIHFPASLVSFFCRVFFRLFSFSLLPLLRLSILLVLLVHFIWLRSFSMFFSPLALCCAYNHIGGQNTHNIVGMGGPPGMGGFNGIFCFLFVSRIGLIIARLYATLSSLVCRCIHFPASLVSCVLSRFFPDSFHFPCCRGYGYLLLVVLVHFIWLRSFSMSLLCFFSPLPALRCTSPCVFFSYNHIGGQNTHNIVGMGGPPGMGGFNGMQMGGGPPQFGFFTPLSRTPLLAFQCTIL